MENGKGLAGKIAMVTGGSRGIGRAIAVRFAREGAHLVIAARDKALLTAAAEEIGKAGGKVKTFAADLREPEARGARGVWGDPHRGEQRGRDAARGVPGAFGRRLDGWLRAEIFWRGAAGASGLAASERTARRGVEHHRHRRAHAGPAVYHRRFGERRVPFVYQGSGGYRDSRWRAGERHQSRIYPHRPAAWLAAGRCGTAWRRCGSGGARDGYAREYRPAGGAGGYRKSGGVRAGAAESVFAGRPDRFGWRDDENGVVRQFASAN